MIVTLEMLGEHKAKLPWDVVRVKWHPTSLGAHALGPKLAHQRGA